MRKNPVFLVIFMLTFTLFTLSSPFFAKDFAIKINDNYIMSIEEFKTRVNRQDEDLPENEKKRKVLISFANEVVVKEALKEEDLEITEEDFYATLRRVESDVTSDMNDTYPLGHFSGDDPPKEKIMERLVGFDEFDFTYEELERGVRQNAGRHKLHNHFKEEYGKEFDENKEERKEEFNKMKEKAEEDFEELSEEMKEYNKPKLERIRKMTFDEYKEREVGEKASEKAKEFLNEIKEELEIETNEEL